MHEPDQSVLTVELPLDGPLSGDEGGVLYLRRFPIEYLDLSDDVDRLVAPGRIAVERRRIELETVPIAPADLKADPAWRDVAKGALERSAQGHAEIRARVDARTDGRGDRKRVRPGTAVRITPDPPFEYVGTVGVGDTEGLTLTLHGPAAATIFLSWAPLLHHADHIFAVQPAHDQSVREVVAPRPEWPCPTASLGGAAHRPPVG